MRRTVGISIKRTHGLGNLVMLLPVVDKLAAQGVDVHLVTRPDWIEAVQSGRPDVTCSATARAGTIDLDAATCTLAPTTHRTLEFARLLRVTGPFDAPRLHVPKTWSEPFVRHAGALVIAPESGHPARSWPVAHLKALASRLAREHVVLSGLSETPALPCRADLRGRLSLPQLLGLLDQARAVLCFDSGMLHLAMARAVPTLAIFGGIEPRFRATRQQRVRVLQAELDCCPCNKAETCAGRYPCLAQIAPEQVVEALASIDRLAQREILRIKVPACLH
ncbi:glycosyltransferase family 9 protein (plasmid) [Burkholderia sp. FERM BP-3421]|jgi:ADP-heptose:LPS heptosyltransferase|uniref:glycosyltransferase family 9 protein n=1 Tax=Burkholderia sp. FERM BP-3421 TaxID=1494466 RepID=UPI00236252DE|nr:glycosyltransferase family 9 protein [Burkholderia sp. FERM BP-3421]WDD90464.1 glycosyltransferase family 9 protein [Burkholderia sp. FERM BP-3421]